jgi:hypothetical protein
MKTFRWLLAIVIFSAVSLMAEEARESGRIAGLNGLWLNHRTGHKVQRGDLVHAGDKIYPGPNNIKGTLTLGLFGRGAESEYPIKLCATKNAGCPSEYVVPAIGETPSLTVRLRDAIQALIPTAVRELHFALSKGGCGPREAVLLAGTEQPDLAQALLPVSPGEKYNVELIPWSLNSGLGKTIYRSELSWKNGVAAVKFSSSVPAGLYQIEVLDIHEESVGAQAYVLLTPAHYYKQNLQAFNNILQSVEGRRLESDEQDPEAFRRFSALALQVVQLHPEWMIEKDETK